MPANHALAFQAVEFTISFASPISRFVVPPEVANLFEGHTLFHFDIDLDTGEEIFEGPREMRQDGFELGRTVEDGQPLFVRMAVESFAVL
jgi:hypothetical protein